MDKKPLHEYNLMGVNIQLFLTILVLIIGIVSIFAGKKVFILFEFLLGLDLFSMAYNNHNIYKRKNTTILYIISGIVMIVFGILSVIGVI